MEKGTSEVRGLGRGFRLHARRVRPERGPARGRLYVLHGFFGAGRNWASVARGLVRARPDWEVVLTDLRLHGESLRAPPPHTVESAAADVVSLVREPAPPGACQACVALLGHSFGGKVALAATARLSPPPMQVWIVDSTPEPGRTGAGAAAMLGVLRRSPPRFDSRAEAAELVASAGFGRFIGEWMSTNLVRTGDGTWRWRFDLDDMEALLVDFFRSDLWPVVEHPPGDCELRFVRASRDSILTDEAADRIERLESEGTPVRLDVLDGGHWLNTDNPAGLLQLLRTGLPRV